jgi:hypothetical protein
LEFPAAGVVQDTGPRVVGLAYNNSIGMACGFLGKSGRVRSANHDGNTASAEFPGKAIRMKRRRSRGSDSYQIGRHIEPHPVNDLIRV